MEKRDRVKERDKREHDSERKRERQAEKQRDRERERQREKGRERERSQCLIKDIGSQLAICMLQNQESWYNSVLVQRPESRESPCLKAGGSGYPRPGRESKFALPPHFCSPWTLSGLDDALTEVHRKRYSPLLPTL